MEEVIIMNLFEDTYHRHNSPGMRAARLLGLIVAVVLIAVVLSNPITLGAGVALAMLATVAVLCIAPRLLTNPPKLSSRPGPETSRATRLEEGLKALEKKPSSLPPPPPQDLKDANASHLDFDAALNDLEHDAEHLQDQELQLEDSLGKSTEQRDVAGRGDSMRDDNEHGLNE